MFVDHRRTELVKIMAADPDITIKDAMIKAGYSPSYAASSSPLVKSASFIEKLNNAIKDDSIVETIKTILRRRKFTRAEYPIETEDEYILQRVTDEGGQMPEKIKIETRKRDVKVGAGKKTRWVEEEYQVKVIGYYIPDDAVVDRMLDRLFKLRGDYAPEKRHHTGVIVSLSQALDAVQNDIDATHKPIADNANGT